MADPFIPIDVLRVSGSARNGRRRSAREPAVNTRQPLGEAAVAATGVGGGGGPRDHSAGTDDHGRDARTGDRGIEHLAPQKVRATGRVGDDHRDRELDPLAAMDRAGVGEAEAVCVLGCQPEDGVVGGKHERGVIMPPTATAARAAARATARAAARAVALHAARRLVLARRLTLRR